MMLQEVLSLLTLIGGAVYGTFQIVWTITHDNKKTEVNRRTSPGTRLTSVNLQGTDPSPGSTTFCLYYTPPP